MEKITIETVVGVTGGRLLQSGSDNFITGVKHDSRQCGQGDMFVAIKGENHDGHDYIPQVAEQGCCAVLVSHTDGWADRIKGSGLSVIEVEETVYAMGQLAAYYLDTLDVLKIAVTGSVGKTSTRDMIYYTLSEKYRCGRNMKNYNNDIGLPISIFQFDRSMEAVVLEMGMNNFGEIDRLADIVRPHIAVITNIGVAHMENLGSREGIFRAKMEIAGHITDRAGEKGALVFPYDGEFLTRERTAGDYRQIMIGREEDSDYRIYDVDDLGLDGIKFTVEHDGLKEVMNIPVPGEHNAVNGALAVAVGSLAGLTADEIRRGLAKVSLTGSRLKLLKSEKLSVIDDTYNASPDSMKSALRVLENSSCDGKKIAVLGDMYELGDDSEKQHFETGAFAAGLHIDGLIAVGREAEHIADGAAGGNFPVAFFCDKDEACREIERIAEAGDMFLVKGSRGMKMERIVEKILDI